MFVLLFFRIILSCRSSARRMTQVKNMKMFRREKKKFRALKLFTTILNISIKQMWQYLWFIIKIYFIKKHCQLTIVTIADLYLENIWIIFVQFLEFFWPIYLRHNSREEQNSENCDSCYFSHGEVRSVLIRCMLHACAAFWKYAACML